MIMKTSTLQDIGDKRLLMGNEALGRGMVSPLF
jgi:hypothetical protein